MLFTSFVNKRNNFETKEIWDYLQKFDVNYDNPERTAVVRDNGKIVGTGSVDGKVMKYFFIDEEYMGHGLLSMIYNALLNFLLENNRLEHYVFTTPNNGYIFQGIGLTEVVSTDRVSLFEGGFSSYDKWIKSIKEKLNPKAKTRGAVVVNCNPMTLGHKHLLEYAKSKVDELIVFIVEEDKSTFTTEERYSIVKNEYKNDDKVVVILGGPYIISQATFPTYFIKKLDETTDIYTELDATIFSKRIAKDLKINIRFVGDEPIDLMTANYNENLLKSFEKYNLLLEKIDRIKDNGTYISASVVRRLIEEGKVEDAYKLLPKSTIDFLKSDLGKSKIKEIQEKRS